MLRAESTQGAGTNGHSGINIYLGSGPSHIDMFDMKPEAPPEIRGEFHPIATTVPGMQICHLMPKLAGMAGKFTIIRSLTGLNNEHSPSQTETGWKEFDLKSIGGHPSLGSVVAKLHGPTNGPVPRFVDLNGHSTHGFLGPVYSAFRPDNDGRGDLRLRPEITMDRFHNRAELLKQLDRVRRDIDSSRMMEAMDAFNGRAMGVITSSKLAEALDWEKADPKIRERYGIPESNDNSRFLVARRLVECGVRIVSFSWGGWDTHTENFTTLRRQLPPLDTALSAMINDLDEQGLLATTTIAMWGEFGRSPRIGGGGRDHWPRAASVFIAGGGFTSGQVIGSTNRWRRNGPGSAGSLSRSVRHVLSPVGHRPADHDAPRPERSPAISCGTSRANRRIDRLNRISRYSTSSQAQGLRPWAFCFVHQCRSGVSPLCPRLYHPCNALSLRADLILEGSKLI